MNLKENLIQIGEEQPELREHLRAIIDSLSEDVQEKAEEEQ